MKNELGGAALVVSASRSGMTVQADWTRDMTDEHCSEQSRLRISCCVRIQIESLVRRSEAANAPPAPDGNLQISSLSASSSNRQFAGAASAASVGLRLYRGLDASQRRLRQVFEPARQLSALPNSTILYSSFGNPVAVSNEPRNLGNENTPWMSAPKTELSPLPTPAHVCRLLCPGRLS